MVAEIGLEGDAPVGCDAADRALTGRIDAERQLGIGRQRTVSSEFQIEQVVEKAVSADPCHLLRVYLLYEGGGGRHRRQRRTYRRKAPGGDRVPDILDRWVVVGGHAPEQSVAVDIDRFREAYVRIVPPETAADPIICPLNESADVVGDTPAGE